ncbi:MAG: MerR family transcriptional regulator [Pseudomonadales bacterium]
MSKTDTSHYNIGAAARLSGVSREKIRIWERRYGAVTPSRDDTNHRLYSREDIERLSLIRKLTAAGHGVSSVATLSLTALQARLRDQAGVEVPADVPRRALWISAEGGGSLLLQELGVAEVQLADSAAAAETWLSAHQPELPDLVVAELPTLLSHDLPTLIRLLRRAPGCRLLVVYRFASRALLEQLRALGMQAVKAPLQADDLQLPQPHPPTAPDIPPDHRARRYTPEQLRQAAARADELKCECPRHLVDLVRDLSAFEDYSLGCETDAPGDAAMHREIYDVVARARALVEDALGIVASEENLPV